MDQVKCTIGDDVVVTGTAQEVGEVLRSLISRYHNVAVSKNGGKDRVRILGARRWREDEDTYVLESIKDVRHNKKGVISAARHLGRTPAAVRARWFILTNKANK